MRAAVRLPRAGYRRWSKLLVVMAMLVALGAVVAPSAQGDDPGHQGEGRGRPGPGAGGRGPRGGGRGEPGYRLAISTDGARVRIAPDDQAFDTQAISPDDDVDGPVVAEDGAAEAGVTARPLFDAGRQGVTDDAGWVRVATFHTDGTCRDDLAVIEVREPGVAGVVGPHPRADRGGGAAVAPVGRSR